MAKIPEGSPGPAEPSAGPVPVRAVRAAPTRLEDVKKGDWVRLLAPHYDGFQRIEAGTEVQWWNDTPPDERNACLTSVKETPLSAPPMTDGKPPADYVDPSTGQKPVVPST